MKPQGYIPELASPSAREGADLHICSVVKIAALLGGVLVACILVVALFFHLMEKTYPSRTSEAAPMVMESELPPLPRLQTNPQRDLQAVRVMEDSHLEHYAWIDHEHGIAQIPIERAMVLWTQNYSVTSPLVSPTGAATNAAPATELQMRQQKAQEAPHAP